MGSNPIRIKFFTQVKFSNFNRIFQNVYSVRNLPIYIKKNQLNLLHQSLKDNFHIGILSELHRPIICTHILSLMKNKSGCSYVLYLLQFSIFNLNILPSNLAIQSQSIFHLWSTCSLRICHFSPRVSSTAYITAHGQPLFFPGLSIAYSA